VALAPTQYARSGDADIAYQVIGAGERDLMLILDWASHLEAVSEQPLVGDFIESLARMGRMLWFDMRGIGMSGHVAGGGTPIEAWMDDVVAVMDAAGSRSATIIAQGHATQMAVMTAATHPERVTSLVLINGFARFARADDYPAGMPPTTAERYLDGIEAMWGTGALVVGLAP
jgi:pimeloyl-ACP methyl ester carboxylesterase